MRVAAPAAAPAPANVQPRNISYESKESISSFVIFIDNRSFGNIFVDSKESIFLYLIGIELCGELEGVREGKR